MGLTQEQLVEFGAEEVLVADAPVWRWRDAEGVATAVANGATRLPRP